MAQSSQWLWVVVGVVLALLALLLWYRLLSRRAVVVSEVADKGEDQWREDRQQALGKVRQVVWALRTSDEIEGLVKVVWDALRELEIPFQDYGINIIESEAGRTTVHNYFIHSYGEWMRGSYVVDGPGNALIQIWHEGEPVYRRDLSREDPYNEWVAIAGGTGKTVRSVLDVPFSHGTLAVNSPDPDAFSKRDIDLLQDMAAAFSGGFRRIQDLRELETRNAELEVRNGELEQAYAQLQQDEDARSGRERQLEGLEQVRQAVWNMQHTEEIEQVVRVLRQVLKDLDVIFQDIGINIITLTEDGPRIRLYFIGEHGKWVTENYILREETNPLMEIWRRGEPDYRRDLHSEDLRRERMGSEESVDHPVRSLIDLPFSHGTLALNSAEPEAFTDRDIAVLGEMCAALSEGFRRLHDLEEVEQRQEHLSSIIRAVPDIIYRLDREGRITFISEAVERYGYRIEDLLGRSIFELVHPEDREKAEYRLNERRTGERGTRALEIRLLTGTGRTDHDSFPMLLVNAEGLYNAFDPQGPNRLGTQGVARDISDRKELEEQLLQARKMEAIGQLAGGIAHDFNNMLMAILNSCEILLMGCGEEDEMRVELELIYKAGERAAALTQQILAFSRRQILQPQVLDLNEVVGAMGGMLQRLIGEGIEWTIRPFSGLGRVSADRVQIEQVVMNLVVNARDAMPDGGQLTIETGHMDGRDADSDFEAGPYVMFAVSDTGVGIAAEIIEQIWEPFFTTKDIGEGTGMGLAIVYGIVKQSNGHIAVESEVGVGTCFRIYLPHIDASVEDREQDERKDLVFGTETVLLVEDDELIRSQVHRILEQLHYKVVVASSGQEALQIWETQHQEIDLLLTDVVMSEINGTELATRLRESRPGLATVLMSGYAKEEKGHPILRDAAVAFIAKPFSLTELSTVLRRMLDG